MNINVTSTTDTGLPGTLRAAVNTANANPGSTIFLNVTPITITGAAMNLTTNMTIVGNVANSTIIHSPLLPGSALFNITSPSITPIVIASITIQGAVLRNTTIPALVLTGTRLNINTCTLTGLRSTLNNGGAIRATNSLLTITSSTISLCTAINGGGLHCTGGTLNIQNSTITANGTVACIGGGGALTAGTIVTINNTTFSGNTSLTFGGGLALSANTLLGQGSDATITNSTFSTNSNSGAILGLLSGGGGIGVFGSDLVMVNCTVANNSSTLTGGGISVSLLNLLLGSLQLVNVTISANSVSLINVGGAGLYAVGITPALGNCILAANTAPLVGALSPDGILLLNDILSPFTTEGGNVIGTSVLGFTNGVNNDKVGSNLAPLNPGISPLANNGGSTQTMAVQATSPAINNGIGTNPLIIGVLFDQRGAPFDRFVGTTVDSGAYEFQTPIICFDGKSRVHTRDTRTGVVADRYASDIYSGVHEVFNTATNKFVPIRFNIVTGRPTRIYMLKRGLLGPYQPNCDFYITAGHPIVIDGEEIPSHKVPGVEQIDGEPRVIYSICTDERHPILINGIEVMTWSVADWESRPSPHLLAWHDNRA